MYRLILKIHIKIKNLGSDQDSEFGFKIRFKVRTYPRFIIKIQNLDQDSEFEHTQNSN